MWARGEIENTRDGLITCRDALLRHRASSALLDKTKRCVVDFDNGHDVDDDDNDENTQT